MLNKIWPIFIIISFVNAFFSGRIEDVSNGIFDSTKSAVELSITFLGTMCLWNGVMNIAYKTKLIENIVKLFNPIINKLFPDLKNNKKIKKEISMNLVANVLGLGNASTPLGIKAMESLQEINEDKERMSNSMMILIVLNTASLQLIPATIIAIRSSLNSLNPSEIIVPVWISSIVSVCSAVLCAKVLIKINKNN